MSKYNRRPCVPYQAFSFMSPTGETEWESWNARSDAWADEVELIEDIDADPWGLAKTTPLEPQAHMVCMCKDAWTEREGIFYMAIDHDCKPEPTISFGWKFELIKVYSV